MLRAEMLGEIMAHQVSLYTAATGEIPPADASDIIAKAATLCIERLLPLLQPPTYYPAQDFSGIGDIAFANHLFN